MAYSMEDVEKWSISYKKHKSFSKVSKQFGVNIKTVSRLLKKHKDSLSLNFTHVEHARLKTSGLKKCKECCVVKSLDSFGFVKSSRQYRYVCSNCKKLVDKKYRDAHKKEAAEYQKQYRFANKALIKERDKNRYISNKDQRLAQTKKYYYTNRKAIRAQRRKIHKKRMQTDVLYSLRHNMRARMNIVFKYGKNSSILKYMGCTIEELKLHLEKQFYNHPKTGENMTWGNKGFRGWHVDHIIPISNAQNKEELIKLFHYKNLQPLWAEENFKKGSCR